MVKLEGTKLKVLPVADEETAVKSLFQKCSSSISLLSFPWSSNISASELDLEQHWPLTNVRAFRAADGYCCILLGKVFLLEGIFSDTKPLISVCLAAELHARA